MALIYPHPVADVASLADIERNVFYDTEDDPLNDESRFSALVSTLLVLFEDLDRLSNDLRLSLHAEESQACDRSIGLLRSLADKIKLLDLDLTHGKLRFETTESLTRYVEWLLAIQKLLNTFREALMGKLHPSVAAFDVFLDMAEITDLALPSEERHIQLLQGSANTGGADESTDPTQLSIPYAIAKDSTEKSPATIPMPLDQEEELSAETVVNGILQLKIKDDVLCPLEKALHVAKIGLQPNYSAKQFIDWVFYIEQTPPLVGILQSAHLHRERGFLHHEYIIMAFGTGEIPTSWLRAERAARFKRHRLQNDSFGPIIGGATLRETITISSSKEALTSGDEIATVIMTYDSTTQNEGLHSLQFKDAVAAISANSAASNKYRLFSENCRFFARRSVLSVLEAVAISTEIHQNIWKGETLADAELSVKLSKEWAGGKELLGVKGVQIRASSLIRLARGFIVGGKLKDAIRLCQMAINELEASPTPSNNHTSLLCIAHLYRGDAYMDHKQYSYALQEHEHACHFAKALQSQYPYILSQSKESLAITLTYLRRFSEAKSVQSEVTAYIRTISMYTDVRSRVLARSLYNQASTLIAEAGPSPNPISPDALVILDEAIRILQKLFESAADGHRQSLAEAIYTRSCIYDRQERWQDALGDIRQAIRLLRSNLSSAAQASIQENLPSPRRIPDYILPQWLYSLSKPAQRLGLYDMGFKACLESASLLRPIYERDRDPQRGQELVIALFYQGFNLEKGGSLSQALHPWREALPISRALYEAHRGSHWAEYARMLYTIGNDDVDEAEDVRVVMLRESLSMTTTQYDLKPDDSLREAIVERANGLSIVASNLGLWEEACTADQIVLQTLGYFYAQNPAKHLIDMATMSSNYGLHQYHAKRTASALQTLVEAVHYSFQLQQRDPSFLSLFKKTLNHVGYVLVEIGNNPLFSANVTSAISSLAELGIHFKTEITSVEEASAGPSGDKST